MKRILTFLKGHISEAVINARLWEIDNVFQTNDCFDDVPNQPGIYILAARKTMFQYPKGPSNGLSPILYIGTSNHLKTRLKQHLKLYKEAKEDFNKCTKWMYSRYNYIVAFGADLYYLRVTGCEKEKDLESKAIESFYDTYGALPVGNGANSYR